MPWTRATHLNHWADTELASRHLPLLVRKLIRRTVPDLIKLSIPANEQTVRPGFDGIVDCRVGNQYVPAGKSVWEMGTNQNPKSKANDDITLRTTQLTTAERAETTFVFVTPRSWQKEDRDDWSDKMCRQGGWKGVIVHDSNDLEHWLDMARDIDAWISHETRQLPPGTQSLAHFWSSLSRIGEHTLCPEVFIASREIEIQGVDQLLKRNPDSLFIRTPSLNDGIDFLAGLAARKSEEFEKGDPAVEPQHLSLLQNAVIVHSLDHWHQLAQSSGSLLLIASPALHVSSADVSSAVQGGHYAIVSGPRGIVPVDKGVVLRGVQQYELEQALKNSGYSDSQAASLSMASAGSTSILKRQIAVHPETVLPPWAVPDIAPSLAFFALVGGWVHIDPNPQPQITIPEAFRYVPPGDIAILELAGYSLTELDRLVTRWQQPPEPFFLKFGDSVLVTSREDAWYLLGDWITGEQLRQFSELAILVLDEENPALELDRDKRWMASIYGKRHSISGELRRSLVETLAIMATCPTANCPSQENRFTAMIARIVNAVLPAKCGWKRWASLRSHFCVIAEAAPELFLGRIEADLDSTEPSLPQLFHENTGNMFGGWLHCELLWALETLAWSPEYLSRVSVILAKLASLIPPPGNHANRPENSLHEIFLLWLPHTNATIDDRVAALKQVLIAAPVAGWKLLLELLPAGHSSVSHPRSMPRWRPWADGWSRESAHAQLYDYAMAVAELVFARVGYDPEKWSECLQGMLGFNDELSERTISALHHTADQFRARPDDAFKLWDALRNVIQRHREFQEAKWAFPKETVDALAEIRDQLVPSDPVLKHLWIFDKQAQLPGYGTVKDFDNYYLALEDARKEAIREICQASGSEGVWRLLELGADGHRVGFACGQHALITEQEAQLPTSLLIDDEQTAAFVRSYVIASYYHRGEWKWIDALRASEWPSNIRVRLALCLPFAPETWDWVENQEAETKREYWSRAWGFLNWDEPTVRRAVTELLAVRRPLAAINLVGLHQDERKPSDLIADVLEAGLFKESIEKSDNVSYRVQTLIGNLQADSRFDRTRLARLEWGYLPLLDREHSPTGPETLIAAAIETPSFYIDLIRAAYRGENAPNSSFKDSDDDRFRARRAGELLEHLEHLPAMDKEGNIDAPRLTAWVTETLKLSEESGHSEITAHTIGKYIGRAIYPHLENPSVASQLAPIVESHGNDALLSGLVNAILNSRAVTWRGPYDGGKLEHELAEKFRERASLVRSFSPKLANCFDTIQRRYEDYARREDEAAERLRTGR